MAPMIEYAVFLDCPHATRPTIALSLWVHDTIGTVAPCDAPRLLGIADGCPVLWVPTFDSWTIDTLRMVLHELAALLPADADATADITARQIHRSNRGRKTPRPPALDKDVKFSVTARGWRAVLHADADRRPPAFDRNGALIHNHHETGHWSVPMIATLLDLAARSPFPLAQLLPRRSAGHLTVPAPSRRHEHAARLAREEARQRLARYFNDD